MFQTVSVNISSLEYFKSFNAFIRSMHYKVRNDYLMNFFFCLSSYYDASAHKATLKRKQCVINRTFLKTIIQYHFKTLNCQQVMNGVLDLKQHKTTKKKTQKKQKTRKTKGFYCCFTGCQHAASLCTSVLQKESPRLLHTAVCVRREV